MDSTQRKILDAARRIFLKKGYDGARMQEIADDAGINKALLHYYFHSKDHLYETFLIEAFEKILPLVNELVLADLPIVSKIELFVYNYLSITAIQPEIASFLQIEFQRNPQKCTEILAKGVQLPDWKLFLAQIQAESQQGKFISMNPQLVLLQIFSLCLFPFVAKNLATSLLNISETEYRKLIEENRQFLSSWLASSFQKVRD